MHVMKYFVLQLVVSEYELPYLSSYKTGFCPSRMTSNTLISPMKFYYNTHFSLPRQSQRSRSILQDGSRSLGLFWKEKKLRLITEEIQYWKKLVGLCVCHKILSYFPFAICMLGVSNQMLVEYAKNKQYYKLQGKVLQIEVTRLLQRS